MAKASPLQPSFSAGEFSPRIFGRVDSERYKTGLETCLNYIPTTQGPLIPRPGFKYVGNDVKDPAKPPALIPFQFSQTQNYVIEAGERYMRFYTNNGQILTSGTSFIVYGYGYQDKTPTSVVPPVAWPFTATRSSLDPYTGEMILTGSSNSFSLTGSSAFVAGGSVLELPTIYTGSSYLEIKYAQRQDVLYLFHKDYPTYKLIRRASSDWTLQKVRFQDGPYLPPNSYSLTGDSIRTGLQSVQTSGTSTISVTTYPIIGLDRITAGTSNAVVVKTLTPHSFLSGDRAFFTSVSGSGITYINNALAFSSWPVSVIDNLNFIVSGAQFIGTYTGSTGSVQPALFTGSSTLSDIELTNIAFFQGASKYWGHARPTTAVGAIVYMDPSTPAFFGSSLFWRLGVWNSYNGFPSAGCFHQQRLTAAGATKYPQRIDLSVSADYDNFSPSNSSFVVADNNAISFNLDHAELNKINWVKSDDKGLLAGTFASEFQITPNNQAAALSPTNINAVETSAFGSYDADALKVGNATIYIQRAQKAIRELNYFFQVDTYRSTDITEISEHITNPSIFKIVSQKETVPIVWTLRSDGTLLSMCYSRDDVSLQVGWSRHKLGGQSDSGGSAPIVKSMAVIPDPTGLFDQLWITARRYINGTSVVSVEYMSKSLEHDALQEDFFNSDMGATYDAPKTIVDITISASCVVTSSSHGMVNGDEIQITKVVGLNSSVIDVMGVTHSSNIVNYHQFVVGSATTHTFYLKDINNPTADVSTASYSPYFSGGEIRKRVLNISGLSWLKNETVAILADGKIHPQTQINSGGTLTLQYRAAKVQIGLPYNMDGKTLRPDAGAQDGTSIGKKRRTSKVALMLNKVFGIFIGPSFDRLTPLEMPGPTAQADTASPLFNGIVRESLEGEFNFEGQVCFRQSSPTGGMVQSVTKFIEENDV